MNADDSVVSPRQMCILALDTNWFSAHGGITTVNRQLCVALASAGAQVFCVVPEASVEEIRAAASVGVTLVAVPPTPGVEGHDRLLRRPTLPDGLYPDLIIGHGRITGPAACALVEDHFPRAARLHVIHTSPDETEWVKLDEIDDAGERAQPRHETEMALASTATRVAAVGPRLHAEALRNLSTYPGVPTPIRLDPGFDGSDLPVRTPPPGAPMQILILGRMEDAGLKGLTIAASAIGHSVAQKRIRVEDIEVMLRGARPGTQQQLRTTFQERTQQPALRIAIRTYTTSVDELQHDLRRASVVLMPSRAEAFGLVGAEAIMAGTPVLVSGRSGLGMLLSEKFGSDTAVPFVVPVVDDPDLDARQWGEALAAVLSDRPAAFAWVDSVRRFLADDVTWARAATDVLTVCGRAPGLSGMGNHHWVDSVQVTLPDGQIARLFSGRTKVLRAVTGWLDDISGTPAAIVTGDPGSGKSAVLAWFALCGDSATRTWLHESSAVTVPEDMRWIAVHAHGCDTDDVVRAIAMQAGVPAANAASLLDGLAHLTGRTCIVIDAIDEATEVRTLITDLVQPLSRGRGHVRLLIGGRRHVVRHLKDLARTFDLDVEYADPEAVEGYADALLSQRFADTRSFHASAHRTRRVARAVAKAAGRSFLITRLVAVAIVARGELPSRTHRFPHEVGEAMSDYLDAVTGNRRRAEDLLRPLAFAHGQGLPAALWADLAGALAGTPGAYGLTDVAALFGGPLASLLSTVRALGRSGGAVGRASYLLFHDALAGYLATVPAAFPDAPQNGDAARETITATLIASVPEINVLDAKTRNWAEADRYVRDHLLEHALGTAALRGLVHDPTFLVAAGGRSVRRVLGRLPNELRTVESAYESVSQHQGDAERPMERAAYLALAALRTSSRELIEAWGRPSRAAMWWPLTSWWRPPTHHRVVGAHEHTVYQVGLAETIGATLAVSASEDGTVGLSEVGGNAPAEIIGEPANSGVVMSGPVRALAIVDLDGAPVVVAGTADGRLTTIDLPGGQTDGSTSPMPSPVTALAAVPDAGDPEVVAGYEDGTVRVWRVSPASVTSESSIDGTEILAVASMAPTICFVATAAGGLWRWNPAARTVHPVYSEEPTVSALAATRGLTSAADAVTGHTDGSIRLWSAASDEAIWTQLATDATVTAVAATRVGNLDLVLTADEESDVIRMLDVGRRVVLPTTLTGHSDALWHLVLNDVDGRPIVLGAGGDDRVHLWSLGNLAAELAARPANEPAAGRWSPSRLAMADERLLAVAFDGGEHMAVLDAVTGDMVAGPFSAPDESHVCATAVTVDTAGLTYAVATAEALIGVAVDGTPPTWFDTEIRDWIQGLAFTVVAGVPTLVGVTTGGTIIFVDPAGNDPVYRKTVPDLFGPVTAVSVDDRSPDGPVLLLGGRQGTVGMWRLSSLEPLMPARHVADEPVTSVALADDRVIAGTLSGRLWLGTSPVAAHHQSIDRLLYSGGRLTSGGRDGRVLVWEPDGTLVTTVDIGAPVIDLLPLSDGHLAISSPPGTVVIELRHGSTRVS